MVKKKTTPKEWICYCLQSDRKYTYVGITNNFTRRHRQHNGEITGGARFTRRYRPWGVLFKIYGLKSQKEVLQLEWALKHRRKRGYAGIKGRVRTLEYLLGLDKWTKKAPARDKLRLTIRCTLTKREYMAYAGIKEWKIRKGLRFVFY